MGFENQTDLNTLFDTANSVNDDDTDENIDEIFKSTLNTKNHVQNNTKVEPTLIEEDFYQIIESEIKTTPIVENNSVEPISNSVETISSSIESISSSIEPISNSVEPIKRRDESIDFMGNIGKILHISDVFRGLDDDAKKLVAQLVEVQEWDNEQAIIIGIFNIDENILDSVNSLVNICNISSREQKLLYILRLNSGEISDLANLVGRIIQEEILSSGNKLYELEEIIESSIYTKVNKNILDLFNKANKVFEIVK